MAMELVGVGNFSCVVVDASHCGASAAGHVVRHCAVAAAQVEHTLLVTNAFDKEIVVAREAMLGVNALAMGHGQLADHRIERLLDAQQEPQAIAGRHGASRGREQAGSVLCCSLHVCSILTHQSPLSRLFLAVCTFVQ